VGEVGFVFVFLFVLKEFDQSLGVVDDFMCILLQIQPISSKFGGKSASRGVEVRPPCRAIQFLKNIAATKEVGEGGPKSVDLGEGIYDYD
jgi:DNA-directed RNA polymerase alpha subunit